MASETAGIEVIGIYDTRDSLERGFKSCYALTRYLENWPFERAVVKWGYTPCFFGQSEI